MGRGEGRVFAAPVAREASIGQKVVAGTRLIVAAQAPRVAELGEWPDYIDSVESLAGRVPTPDQPSSGFDAGVACCLDLIPRDKQKLAATLHAAYTPQAVAQVIRESDPAHRSPDSSTAWWLAACSVCTEGRLSPEQFQAQLNDFHELAQSSEKRSAAAWSELEKMRARFELREGIPYSEIDGGMQGAYVSGHPLAVMYAPEEEIWFVGTYEPSLGLEDFQWSEETDDLGRPRSGPVHNSRQFVKAGSAEELARALTTARQKLGV